MASDFANEGIHDGNLDEFIKHCDDVGHGRGLIPRDYDTHPSGYHAAAPTFPDELLIPPGEQVARLAQQQADKASLWDLREANYSILKSLDQDGLGLCWGFSTTKASMYARAIMGQLGVILSAWWLCGKIKGWRDQGGWGSESMAGAASMGIPSMDLCPSYKSSYDNAATQADAALHKVIDWFDGTDSRAKNEQIMISAMLLGWPTVLDFNNLSHSMAGCYLISLNPTVIATDNSWNDISQYGPKGTMVLKGSNAVPDGIVVARCALPSGK